MREQFIDAEVTGYQELIGAMRNNEKGRHVLAAAVRANAEVIVTADRAGFPPEAVEPNRIEVRHPDEFLLDQIDLYENAVHSAILGILSAWTNPPFTAHRFLDALGAQVPKFATEARRLFPPPPETTPPVLQRIWCNAGVYRNSHAAQGITMRE
jgi:hypothetical protein